jgi:hypothetical protein
MIIQADAINSVQTSKLLHHEANLMASKQILLTSITDEHDRLAIIVNGFIAEKFDSMDKFLEKCVEEEGRRVLQEHQEFTSQTQTAISDLQEQVRHFRDERMKKIEEGLRLYGNVILQFSDNVGGRNLEQFRAATEAINTHHQKEAASFEAGWKEEMMTATNEVAKISTEISNAPTDEQKQADVEVTIVEFLGEVWPSCWVWIAGLVDGLFETTLSLWDPSIVAYVILLGLGLIMVAKPLGVGVMWTRTYMALPWLTSNFIDPLASKSQSVLCL